jgi:hypothetical protein
MCGAEGTGDRDGEYHRRSDRSRHFTAHTNPDRARHESASIRCRGSGSAANAGYGRNPGTGRTSVVTVLARRNVQ